MIIQRVELEDFGCYYGHQQADLSVVPGSGKNLVVIGGLNGAGKTTLLNAITFALFGYDDAFLYIKGLARAGEGKSQRDRILASLLNRAAYREGKRQAAVTLHLLDKGHTIEVRREWAFDDALRMKDERLDILFDGEPLKFDQDPDQEQRDYLKHTIPPHIGRFFMFDGEEIRRIAEANPNEEVRNGIDMLLGFQVLQQLETDLDELHNRYRRESKKRSDQEVELTRLAAEEQQLESQIEELSHERQDLEERIAGIHEQLSKIDARLDRMLGPEGKRPAELRAEQEKLQAESEGLRKQIEGMIEEFVVLALPMQPIHSLVQQLHGEELFRTWDEGRRRVQPQLERLVAEIFSPAAPQSDPPLVPNQRDFYSTMLRDRWNNLFYPPPEGAAKELRHDCLSPEEVSQVRAKCSEVVRRQAPDLRVLLDRLETAERRANHLKATLQQVGEGEEIEKLIETKSRLSRERGQAEEAFDMKRRQTDDKEHELGEKRRQRQRKEDDLARSGKSGELAALARNVRRAVQRYQEELRPRKRDELRKNLRAMYRRLARKEDVVQDIDLDEQTYDPRLLDRQGNSIPIDEFSAGEKEIFALALLWGLAKTSRREVPVVIDTPLGRLDSKHRTNIVTQYLPAAGPQVLVLSTDTELDHQYFNKVRGCVDKTLHLVFDTENERTSIEEGYFDIL
ncbi:MAG: DNA sulfur modification protein DndD [Planctomycetes bacterium]|nr:DNA sulfur modification protein DndD [Planctomycetota bacterium]